MVVILVFLIVIIFFTMMFMKKNTKFDMYPDSNKNTQNRLCLPQPVIFKDNKILLVQLRLDYEVVDGKKEKLAIKNGINIFREIEYKGITTLRKFSENVNSTENVIEKWEKDLKEQLDEFVQEFGVEMKSVHINFTNMEEYKKEEENYIENVEQLIKRRYRK